MPASLDKHCFKGMHGDAIIGAMSRRVRIVVAPPVPFLTPLNPHRIPAHIKHDCSLAQMI